MQEIIKKGHHQIFRNYWLAAQGRGKRIKLTPVSYLGMLDGKKSTGQNHEGQIKSTLMEVGGHIREFVLF